MSQKFSTLVTNLGAGLLAQATATGTQLKITQMAVGDGNGDVPSPLPTQTKLVNEVRRAAVNSIFVDEDNKNYIIIEQVIPPEEGGFYIREIGIFDENDNLIAIGNCPPSYKPILSEGSGRTQVIRTTIMIENSDSVTLKIDASTVLATRKYADELVASAIKAHEQSTNHPDATTKSKGFVQLDSSTDSDSEAKAATPKAIKEIMTQLSNFTGRSLIVGNIELLPFRVSELPFGWYFANGDAYEISTNVGKALQSLSNNYKADWGITTTITTITLPNLFYSDGRGYFLRAVNGSTRQVGSVETDAIRNIYGWFAGLGHYSWATTGGAGGVLKSRVTNVSGPNAAQAANTVYQEFTFDFNASTYVPTASENRTLNRGMTPAIYLGV